MQRQRFSPTILISLFSVAGLAVSVATQLALAYLFGAHRDMDAYLAAITLPMVVMAVLISSFNYVFIPIFIEYQQSGDELMAWRVASTLINLSALILAVLSVIGMVLAKPLLRLTVPGFDSATLQLTVELARIFWPMVMASGLSTLLIGLNQACKHFGRAAAVPVVSAFLTLLLTLILVPLIGIRGVALAALAGGVLQVFLLLPILLGAGHYHFELNLRLSGVHRVLGLLGMLLVAGFFSRGAVLVDRFVASELPVGSIAHLNYANKLVTILITILVAGISVTAFVEMAERTAVEDLTGLRHVMRMKLQVLWLVIAPTVTIMTALRYQVISVLLERGNFGPSDTLVVATILPWYLLAMIAMALGNIVSSGFYALKDTRTLAFISAVEVIAYIAYMPWFAQRLGVEGVAIGFALNWDISLLLISLVIWNKTGRPRSRAFVRSSLVTLSASLVAGLTAVLGPMWWPHHGWLALLVGFSIGGLSYLAILKLMKSEDLLIVLEALRRIVRSRLPSPLKPEHLG